MKRWEFAQKQSIPYPAKVDHARRMAEAFRNEADERSLNCHVSVGGLDSITLLLFLRSIYIDVPAISVTSLEDKSIQRIHRQLGIEAVKPYKSKTEVIKEFGYPVISKAKASKIEHLQKPNNPKQTLIHALMTGDMGEQGHYGHSDKLKLPDKWLRLFAGHYQDHRPDMPCKCAPFRVSARCCEWMKERPCDDWAKAHNSVPYLGLMASEGGQREWGLVKNGCNYWGKSTSRSAPFAIFTRQDLLQLALDLGAPVPEIYGTIEREPDGTLYTTHAQRTGCGMCGFGIHIEERPHRFDRLRQDNPKEWKFWLYDMGWGEVLTYIGVGWEDIPPPKSKQIKFAI